MMEIDEIYKRANKVVDLTGMTVNERLWASGLMKTFDEARNHNKDLAKTILLALKVDATSINKILN